VSRTGGLRRVSHLEFDLNALGIDVIFGHNPMQVRDSMPMDHRPLEIEVKFHLNHPDGVRRRLIGMGAAAADPVFETNTCYENSTHSLQRSDCLLRLRQDRTCRLTYKCPPAKSNTEFKIYHELEVTVSDGRDMAAILGAIGFQAVQTYEKWRESFLVDEARVCIDTMPYGCFLEIEGTQTVIRNTAKNLGLNWEERIVTNYLSIFQLLRQKYQLTFNDLTFSNFAPLSLDISTCLHHFQAGQAAIREDTL
jgi:adenylate cyclase, class 2